jgi:hypothetical protein
VLLSDARYLRANRFAVAALWPRDSFLTHRAIPGPCDPLLLVETIRQSAIHLAHAFHDVPNGHRFVLSDLDFDFDPPSWDAGPLPVALEVALTRTTSNPRRFAMALDAEVYTAGIHRGRAGMRFEVLAPRRYAVIRDRARQQAELSAPSVTGAAATPLVPEVVGYRDDLHVLLASAPSLPDDTWLLRLRQDHPVLFDHESDHISGMALLEACRQAATAAAPKVSESPGARQLLPTAAAAAYRAFGELDSPVTVSAQRLVDERSSACGTPVLQLCARQGSRTLITTTATLQAAAARCSAPGRADQARVAS